ncbi:MAG TPA: hypothetical protein VGQ86_11475 [Candidatus Limnocylindria bacterium]|jgi:hypothetical protein|nr:hypothetical protein [Candidatus Limnocylindria bacterium]
MIDPAIRSEIEKRHDEGVRRLQDWVRVEPSNRTVAGWDDAVASYAAYLFALAERR